MPMELFIVKRFFELRDPDLPKFFKRARQRVHRRNRQAPYQAISRPWLSLGPNVKMRQVQPVIADLGDGFGLLAQG